VLPNSICVLDPLTGRLIRAFGSSGGGGSSGHALVLSADGKALFRSVHNGEVQVFEVATGKFRASYSGHLNEVLALDAPAGDVRR